MADIEIIQPIPRQDPVLLIEKDDLVEGGYEGAANKQAIALLNNIAFIQDRTYSKDDVNEALAGFQSGSFKVYPTLQAANLDISNIPLDTKVSVISVEDGGDYYKETSNSTSLKKAPYDARRMAVEQAEEYTNEIRGTIPLGNAGDVSNLFEFDDTNGNTVAVIRKDGDIANDKYSLNEVGEVSSQAISAAMSADELARKAAILIPSVEELSSTLKHNDESGLFEFEDKNGLVVAEITPDGDFKNDKYSLNFVGQLADEAAELAALSNETANQAISLKPSVNQLEKIIKENDQSAIFEFEDKNGLVVAEITPDGDFLFNGGKSLIELTDVHNDRKEPLKHNEQMTDDFLNLFLQRLSFNGESKNSPVFIGAVKQKFSIKNPSDLLNLKIRQGQPIKIDTPYVKGISNTAPYSQVVHPFLCEFKDKPRGFKYMLLATPFHLTTEKLENPCVWGSNDLINFTLLENMPLSDRLVTSGQRNYNSDPSAAYDHETGEFCAVWRNTDGENNNRNVLYVRRTSDFKEWSTMERIIGGSGDLIGGLLLSPNIVYSPELKKWIMYIVDSQDGFHYRLSDNLMNGWSQKYKITIPGYINPWHQEVRYCGGSFVCIMLDLYSVSTSSQSVGNLYFGFSSDGINWQFSESIFEGQFDAPYKASISPFFEENLLKFHIMWSSNGNTGVNSDGWKLYHSTTSGIEVI